jgi:hypothetical protein
MWQCVAAPINVAPLLLVGAVMRQIALLFVFALAASWPLTANASSASAHFDKKLLSVPGNLLQVTPIDLDGDGKLDLLATFVAGQQDTGQRSFAVFWNTNGTYSAKPDLVFGSDIDACAFDIAPLDGAGNAASLLLVTPNGVSTRSFKGRVLGEAKTLVDQSTFCLAADADELFRLRVVQPLSAAGANDLVVPGLGTMSVYTSRGGHLVRVANLKTPFRARYGNTGRREPQAMQASHIPGLNASFTLPDLHLADIDGDGKTDLVLTHDDELTAYLQGPGFTFSNEPSVRRSFSIRSAEDKQNDVGEVSLQVLDIDNDGVADIVVRKEVNHGITSSHSTLWVFLGKHGTAGVPAESPDQVIELEGASLGDLEIFDVTGDGRADLLVPSVDLGVVSVVRMITTQTLKIHMQVFPFEASRKFADKAAAERDLKMKISLSGQSDVEAVELAGDYNGDGKPDLVLGTGGDELSFYPAVPNGSVFAEDPMEQLSIRARGRTVAADLNQHGRSDLLLYSPATQGHKNEIWVMFNRGGW